VREKEVVDVMNITKPLYKRDWFLFLLTGMVLTSVGLYFIVITILSSRYDGMSIWYGIFYGMGLTDIIVSGAFRNYQKKLDIKTKS
jgi:hypothetical protein